MLSRLSPEAGTIIGALLLVVGGIIVVAGAPTPGTVVAIVGFALILQFRVLPARRERRK